jgi:predicted DsbA family dithiol-disulfide isomerase
LSDALFSAYFEHGEDLADHSVLTRLTRSVGLDAEAAADVLAGQGYSTEVRADLAEAAGLDVHAVPTMVIGGQFTVPGAQDTDTLRSVLVRVGRRMGNGG